MKKRKTMMMMMMIGWGPVAASSSFSVFSFSPPAVLFPRIPCGGAPAQGPDGRERRRATRIFQSVSYTYPSVFWRQATLYLMYTLPPHFHLTSLLDFPSHRSTACLNIDGLLLRLFRSSIPYLSPWLQFSSLMVVQPNN